MQKLPSALFFAGLSTLIGTVMVCYVLVPEIVHWQVTQKLRLEPIEGNLMWNAWKDIKAPIFLNVYVFNITNADEILKGEKPILQELGPYVYEQSRTKEILSVNKENGTVLYKPTMYNYFRSDLSNGTEEDVITMLNLPLLSVANELDTMSYMVRYMAGIYLESFEEEAFLKTTVGTVLFKGSHVPMIESIGELMGRDLLPNNTFGFLYERNGTSPYNFEVDSGMLDSTRLGDIRSWKGKANMDVWDGPTCNMINGSDSTIYPPFETKQSIIRIFEPDICRSLHLTYESEAKSHGLPGYKFTLPKDIFGVENPDNQCFCKESDKSKCPKSGVVSIGGCKQGAPIFLSNPHFLYADPSYAEAFGMVPNATIHESYLILEPRTGVVLEGSKRIQLNTHLKPSTSIEVFANVPDLMVPLIWIDEDADQAKAQLDMVQSMLITPMSIVEFAKWSLLIVSCTMTAIGIIIFFLQPSEKKVVAQETEKFIYI